MLKINGLTKIYGLSDVKAVDDLSLEVESGEIFGFIGPNGAGKTTMTRCLCGLLKEVNGTVRWSIPPYQIFYHKSGPKTQNHGKR